jgi:L-fuconolactonase
MKIDAHQHFWTYDEENYDWIDESMSAIRKNYLPKDLAPILVENKIDGCVLVQVNQTEKETLDFAAHAKIHDFIKGVVGWTDLMSEDLDEKLQEYKKIPSVKGFRHILQGEPEGFMLQEEFIRGVNKLSEYGFTYDVLIFPIQMKEAKQLMKACPETNFVIDHMAKPYVKTGQILPWANYMQKYGELPNVTCKLSGMVTEANWEYWEKEDFFIYLDTALQSFGIDRLMYGSDWPVCLVAATYEKQLGIVQEYFSKLSQYEQNKIFGDNAVKFYNL